MKRYIPKDSLDHLRSLFERYDVEKQGCTHLSPFPIDSSIFIRLGLEGDHTALPGCLHLEGNKETDDRQLHWTGQTEFPGFRPDAVPVKLAGLGQFWGDRGAAVHFDSEREEGEGAVNEEGEI